MAHWSEKVRKVRILEKFAKKGENVEMCGILWKSAESAGFTEKCEKCEKYENGPNFIKNSLDFIRVFAFGAFLVDFPKTMSILKIFTKF